MPWKVLCWFRCVSVQRLGGGNGITSNVSFLIGLTFRSPSQEGTNEVGAAGPSGDYEIMDGRRNNLGSEMAGGPDLMGNSVDGGSSAAQLPQKNILERKEVLIGKIIHH